MTTTQTQEKTSLELLVKSEFTLATSNMELVPVKPSLPGFSRMSDKNIQLQKDKIHDEKNCNGETQYYNRLLQELKQDLSIYEAQLETLIEFLGKEGLDKSSSEAVLTAAAEEVGKVQTAFETAITETLKAQRPIEKNIWSINSFFLEGNCDGTANSVYVINHNPINDELAQSLRESNIKEMPRDPELGNVHPIWETSVDRNGIPMPVTFRPLEQMNVIQTMCAAIAVGANFTGQLQMEYWAQRAFESYGVAFINVSPEFCGPNPWDPQTTPVELRRRFTNGNEIFKNIVAVANHPVVRENTRFEDSPVTVFPSFALLGKIYKMEKVEKERTMCSSPINPSKDPLKEWMIKASCPWILNRRGELNQINIIFIDTSSNRLGDDIVRHFNSACTAYSGKRHHYSVTLGETWLEKVITHHLLQNVGVVNNNRTAQIVGRALHQKLSNLSGLSPAKHFQKAWVDYENSCCIQDPQGNFIQEHSVHVEYNEGVEIFRVIVS